jgi:hypothetical protein
MVISIIENIYSRIPINLLEDPLSPDSESRGSGDVRITREDASFRLVSPQGATTSQIVSSEADGGDNCG